MSLHRHIFVSGAALVCFVLWSVSAAPPRAPIADAPAGKIEGYLEGDLRVFKGIPYAMPPVGQARWKPPASMPRWAEVRKATEYGNACYQPTVRIQTV